MRTVCDEPGHPDRNNGRQARARVQVGGASSIPSGSRRAFGVAKICLLVLLSATPASAQIRWRSGVSQRSVASRERVNAIIAEIGIAELRVARRHLVIQFDRPISPETRAKLETGGVKLLTYMCDNAFFAVAAPMGTDMAVIPKVNALDDAQRIQVAWKLYVGLARGETPEWAVVPQPAERVAEPPASETAIFDATACSANDFVNTDSDADSDTNLLDLAG